MHNHSTCINLTFLHYTLEIDINKNLIDLLLVASIACYFVINLPTLNFYTLDYPTIDNFNRRQTKSLTLLPLRQLKSKQSKPLYAKITHPSRFKVKNLIYTQSNGVLEINFDLTKTKENSSRYQGTIELNEKLLKKRGISLIQSSQQDFSFRNLRHSYYKFDIAKHKNLNKPIIFNIVAK